MDVTARLPWPHDLKPLMLAPMQGLTNRGLRSLFIEWVRPDLVFTELIRVRPGSRKLLSKADAAEIAAHEYEVPLVAQLIGNEPTALMDAAMAVQEHGINHLNLNMGCPFGRMTAKSAGGGLLKNPVRLEEILRSLRQVVAGSLSIKMRAGYEDPQQIFTLIPLFEDTGVDFLILHPRTVLQRYGGQADHSLTRQAVDMTRLPIIANGDITTAAIGKEILQITGAAGLMLGRGAIGDPLLFERMRGRAPAVTTPQDKAADLRYYLSELLQQYQKIFCGDMQVLCKMKAVMSFMADPCLRKSMKELSRCRNLDTFSRLLANIG
jgi:tRNA-dihydrouridine synthase B